MGQSFPSTAVPDSQFTGEGGSVVVRVKASRPQHGLLPLHLKGFGGDAQKAADAGSVTNSHAATETSNNSMGDRKSVV